MASPAKGPPAKGSGAPQVKRKALKPSPPVTKQVLDAVELLNDLSNFVGIGVVEIPLPRMAAPGQEAPDGPGWLWLEPPNTKPASRPDTIAFNLYMLVSLHAVRCTYRMVSPSIARVRVYYLPVDVGRSLISRRDKNIKRYSRKVMDALDVSREKWRGTFADAPTPTAARLPLFELDRERTSLFYTFNTMESPDPTPATTNGIARYLLEEVLESSTIPGMVTEPFEYQKRSIAMMIQRELAPHRMQDSRLKTMFAPSGEVYYLDQETCDVFEQPAYYESVRGGILAEEMGTGKTFICLGVILYTQYGYARVPEEYSLITPKRSEVPSLMDLCVSVVWRHSIPWRMYENDLGLRCLEALRNSHASYEVPSAPPSRRSRRTANNRKETIFVGSGTIIVVPTNLVEQWKSEIAKHVQPDRLKVLVLADSLALLPSTKELLEYDILLFSRTRFDQEEKEGKDAVGRREFRGVPLVCKCTYTGASRTRDCHCFKKEAIYKSPLLAIRWKRLIVDEGHSMGGSSKSNAVCVAGMLSVESRWIVSGTPSPSLLGAAAGMPDTEGETEEQIRQRKQEILATRKDFQAKEAADLDRLGRIVRDFFKLQPWAAMGTDVPASWGAYITKGFTEGRAGSTMCIDNILRSLIIRHREEDIEKSVTLPPLYHKLVYLKPGYTEKISINLLLCLLVTNAVTSERTDKDYIFHPSNQNELRKLVSNMYTQSGFFWTGSTVDEIQSTIRIGEKYLEAQVNRISPKDAALLRKAISTATQALRSETWLHFVKHHEMAYAIDASGLPEGVVEAWVASGDGCPGAPLILDAKQILEMQKHVNSHAYEPESILGEGLQKLGVELMNMYSSNKPEGVRDTDRKRLGANLKLPQAPQRQHKASLGVNLTGRGAGSSEGPARSALKVTHSHLEELPAQSPFLKPTILGTVSVKLSYLLNAILEHHATEKTLVFYENDNVAWYIAQALEILGIEHLAYQKNLPSWKKSQYIVTFHDVDRFRVLLMDLTQAAHGLNVCSASRVYFVNPVWTPSIEAQALKRAHRIGQTRPVYSETLILEGTLEEEMVKRRKSMSDRELKDTKDSMINDSVMMQIISNLQFMPIQDDEERQLPRAAALRLKEPQTLFGANKRGGVIENPEDNLLPRGSDSGGRARSAAGTPQNPTLNGSAGNGIVGTSAAGGNPPTNNRKRNLVVHGDAAEDQPARKKNVRFE